MTRVQTTIARQNPHCGVSGVPLRAGPGWDPSTLPEFFRRRRLRRQRQTERLRKEASSGQYTFVDESKETGSGPTGQGIGRLGELVGVDFADLNSDRQLDILLASKAGPTAPFGNLIVCLNNGYGGMYAEGGTIGIDVPENIVDVEVADLDGNGVPDIIAVPEAATTVRALVGFGDGPNQNYVDASGAYQFGTDLAYGVTTTDIDADSDHDVLLLRPESETSPSDKKFLWANPLLDAPAPAGQEQMLTIGFDPGSLTHNPYGIGAIVAVEVTPPGGATLYSSQVVDGGSGRGGQGAGRLAFGLGSLEEMRSEG